MRTLFIPGAKLLGLFALWRSLFHITYVLWLFYRGVASDKSLFPALTFPTVAGTVGLLLALLLIFKAETIADLLKIPHDSTDSVVIDSASMLPVGLILIGLAVIIYAIPTLIARAATIVQLERPMPAIYQALQALFWTSILQIVLGSCLVLQARRLAQIFIRQKTKQNY